MSSLLDIVDGSTLILSSLRPYLSFSIEQTSTILPATRPEEISRDARPDFCLFQKDFHPVIVGCERCDRVLVGDQDYLAGEAGDSTQFARGGPKKLDGFSCATPCHAGGRGRLGPVRREWLAVIHPTNRPTRRLAERFIRNKWIFSFSSTNALAASMVAVKFFGAPARIGCLLGELAYQTQDQWYGKLDNISIILRRQMAAYEKSLATGRPQPVQDSATLPPRADINVKNGKTTNFKITFIGNFNGLNGL